MQQRPHHKPAQLLVASAKHDRIPAEHFFRRTGRTRPHSYRTISRHIGKRDRIPAHRTELFFHCRSRTSLPHTPHLAPRSSHLILSLLAPRTPHLAPHTPLLAPHTPHLAPRPSQKRPPDCSGGLFYRHLRGYCSASGSATRMRPQYSQMMIFLPWRMSTWRWGGMRLKQPPHASRFTVTTARPLRTLRRMRS